MKDSLLWARVVVRTSNHVVVWQTTSNNYVKKRATRAARLFSSFNQSNHWFVTLSLPLLSSFLKLTIVRIKDANQEVTAPAYWFVLIILILIIIIIRRRKRRTYCYIGWWSRRLTNGNFQLKILQMLDKINFNETLLKSKKSSQWLK